MTNRRSRRGRFGPAALQVHRVTNRRSRRLRFRLRCGQRGVALDRIAGCSGGGLGRGGPGPNATLPCTEHPMRPQRGCVDRLWRAVVASLSSHRGRLRCVGRPTSKSSLLLSPSLSSNVIGRPLRRPRPYCRPRSYFRDRYYPALNAVLISFPPFSMLSSSLLPGIFDVFVRLQFRRRPVPPGETPHYMPRPGEWVSELAGVSVNQRGRYAASI